MVGAGLGRCHTNLQSKLDVWWRPVSEGLWLGMVVSECSLWSPVVEASPLQVKRSGTFPFSLCGCQTFTRSPFGEHTPFHHFRSLGTLSSPGSVSGFWFVVGRNRFYFHIFFPRALFIAKLPYSGLQTFSFQIFKSLFRLIAIT